mgnify:CR=1 FL=1
MVLENYIKLTPGVPIRLHFTAHAIVDKAITDPLTGLPGSRRSLVFTVDRENEVEVSKTFSTLAEKLAVMFEPDLAGEKYKGYEYTITQVGFGFQTRFSVAKNPFLG